MSRLDQFIKDKLRSHTTPVDTDQLWKDIQKKKRKRRGFFFLWWGVGVLGVLSMIFLIWNHVNSNNISIHETSLKPDFKPNFTDTVSRRQNAQNSQRTFEVIKKEKVISESDFETSKSDQQITSAKSENANMAINNTMSNEMEKSVSHTDQKTDTEDVKRNAKTSSNSLNNKASFVLKQHKLNSNTKIKQKKSTYSDPNNLTAQAPLDWNSVSGSVIQKNQDKVKLKSLDSVSVSKESNVIAVVAPVNGDDQTILGNISSGKDSNQVMSRIDQLDSNQSNSSQDSVLVINSIESIAKQISHGNSDSLHTVSKNKISKPYFLNFTFGMSRVNRVFQWDSAFTPSQNKELYAFNLSSTLRSEIYKGICWYGGISFNRIVLQSQYTRLTISDTTSKLFRYEYIDINGLSTFKEGNFNSTEVVVNLYTNYQRINALDFQLGLYYAKKVGNWYPFLNTGLAYNIATITQGLIFNNRSFIHSYKDEININVGSSYQFGFGVEYAINSKNRIGFGSQYQSYMNSFQRESQVTNKFSLWSFQLSYGHRF